jgi:hypothetical protein
MYGDWRLLTDALCAMSVYDHLWQFANWPKFPPHYSTWPKEKVNRLNGSRVLLHFYKERAEKRQNFKICCSPYFFTGKAVKPVMQQIIENSICGCRTHIKKVGDKFHEPADFSPESHSSAGKSCWELATLFLITGGGAVGG